jgi:hypothetical protein
MAVAGSKAKFVITPPQLSDMLGVSVLIIHSFSPLILVG